MHYLQRESTTVSNDIYLEEGTLQLLGCNSTFKKKNNSFPNKKDQTSNIIT